MEMNTRLQVEHPVTEMITGLDLVEWQLRVAAGEPLPLRQDQIAVRRPCHRGAALCRGPGKRDFLPSTGTLDLSAHAPSRRRMCASTPACAQGDAVTPFYDPMIAKLIAWGEDRPRPSRVSHGLARYRLAGVATNRDFLLRLARQPDFAAGSVDTGFIARHRDALSPPPTRSRV